MDEIPMKISLIKDEIAKQVNEMEKEKKKQIDFQHKKEELLKNQEIAENFLNEEESRINALIKPFKTEKNKIQKKVAP